MHALLQFEERRYYANIKDTIFRNVQKYHPTASRKRSVVVAVANDMTWYDEYLRKESNAINHDTDEFDAEAFRMALPNQATQDALQAPKGRRNPCAYYIDHETRWIAYQPVTVRALFIT